MQSTTQTAGLLHSTLSVPIFYCSLWTHVKKYVVARDQPPLQLKVEYF